VGLGVAGVDRVGPALIPFIILGVSLVLGYNLELLHGRLHTTAGFAASWGAFPVLTAYLAQTGGLGLAVLPAAVAAFGLSWAQRRLSNNARLLRRRVRKAEARLVLEDGSLLRWDAQDLLRPLEQALRALSWSMWRLPPVSPWHGWPDARGLFPCRANTQDVRDHAVQSGAHLERDVAVAIGRVG
jgi:hypothetical protein